ncbi:glycosyltransferase [Paenibacillus oceani]|uniref:Glycosyltransferase n=1 Tax=Paenibacillus oceani TaxID=2772510 RepID=A0A927CFG6_9BACL|nr:glycosyltransferase [Paenibacillus oceani]MBD2866499.1 glycosyltransferase [Paenibacillus oceani]
MQKSVLFIIHRLSYGGAEKNLTFVANELSRRGFKVQVFTYEDAVQHYPLDEDVVHLVEKNISTTRGIRRFVQIFQIKKVIKEHKPDVVVSFLNFPNLLSILATMFTSTPVIISERADPYQTNGIFDTVRQYMYRYADGAVFQTDGARDYFTKRLANKSCVIPNPVIQKVKHEPVTERNNEIAFVARFELVQKRQDLMLLAFRKVADKYPDIKLVFYGDGPDETYVRELTERLNLTDHVRFEGVVENVAARIRNARMFVLTSDYEGIPNALIEAMSIGLPVVATDCSPGGARMLIEDKVNGCLVPKGDVDAISNSIIYYIENGQIAEEYGRKATEVVDRFTPKKIMSKWEEYINKHIGGKYAG